MFHTKERRLPSPTYMSKEQKAKYLNDLRSRPVGSRPPPPSKVAGLKQSETSDAPLAARTTSDARPQLQTSSSMPVMKESLPFQARAESMRASRSPFVGRPLARPPSAAPTTTSQSSGSEKEELQSQRTSRPSSIAYVERGSRWMEKQETKSLRQALEDMDLEKEKKLYSAAQDEAAELVWKHQNKGKESETAPYSNPDRRKDYRAHLRRGSYQRSLSQDRSFVVQPELSNPTPTLPKADGSSGTRKVSPPGAILNMPKRRTPSGKSFGGLAEAVASDIHEAQRRVSSGTKRIFSGEKKAFMDPKDRIYEDPQEEATPPKKHILRNVEIKPPTADQPAFIRKNPFARVRLQHHERLERTNSAPDLSLPKRHTIEIQRNAPSQSRNAFYTSNSSPSPESPTGHTGPQDEPTAIEMRGDDIRAATSKRRSDRSPNLPQPTMVSDRAGRPIVSFQEDWKPKEKVLEEVRPGSSHRSNQKPAPVVSAHTAPSKPAFNPEPLKMPPRPTSSNTSSSAKPPIPVLNLPDDDGCQNRVLSEDIEPSAPILGDVAAMPMATIPPLRTMRGQPPIPQRPCGPAPIGQHKTMSSPLPKSTPHYTPFVRQSGALCAQCALPIAGRVLAAAGERFHPACFVCHQCQTNLELVAFYPEPDRHRAERVDRIQARRSHMPIPEEQIMSHEELQRLEFDDGDPALRFYCHLDFHELFSPRCKSCKTPIEGEVIVACGAEWHAGHFFCAQCGDPFNSTTPFVERDGYAWCVGCHTNRYSSKCRKCRKPVTDLVVKALGSDWHEQCFVCTECNGDFEDGRYFLRGADQDPVCVGCEERRLKA